MKGSCVREGYANGPHLITRLVALYHSLKTPGYCWRTSPLVFNGPNRGSAEERRGGVPETERWKGRALVCG